MLAVCNSRLYLFQVILLFNFTNSNIIQHKVNIIYLCLFPCVLKMDQVTQTNQITNLTGGHISNKLNGRVEEVISKAEVLKLIIQKDPAGLTARAFLEVTDALLSLKMLRVELSQLKRSAAILVLASSQGFYYLLHQAALRE